LTELTPNLARNIIERVHTGNPPIHGIEHYTAGLDPYLNVIEKEYLQTYIKDGGSTFKAVIAGYGEGKTHLLFSVQNLAWKHNYASSYVMLSPIETPFHDPERVYRALVKNLAYPPEGEKDPIIGIENFIRHWYVQKKAEFVMLEEREQVQALMDYANSISGFESVSFARAVRQAFISLVTGHDADFEDIMVWLKGEGYDRKTHSKHGIMHKVDKSQAFPLIRSVSQWVSWVGFSGLLILFDETEQVPSFSTKQKEILLSNLRQLIDECGDSFKHVFIVYSFPDEQFLMSRGVVYEALKQRLDTIFGFVNPTGVKIRLDELPIDPKQILVEIGTKLARIYEVAYNHKFETSKTDQTVRNIADVCIKRKIAGAHRRLFVQRLITSLHQMKSNPAIMIDLEKAEEIVSGVPR